MNADAQIAPRGKLTALRSHLVGWLLEAAYPLWSRRGIDPHSGGFFEALTQHGGASPGPRRARVHPRQIYAFAQAARFGWRGDAGGIVRRGIDYFTAYYLRADGLFRTLVGADGVPLEEQALLYDQAFALLGYAAAATALDDVREFERRALDLRHAIEARLGGSDGADGALHSGDAARGAYESNPHMHLLEACLLWSETGNDRGWTDWAKDLAELARSRFIRADSGALGEAYLPSWKPAPGIGGRTIEPGHQFEWGWLLLRRENPSLVSSPLRRAALRLIDVGETYGVHRNVAINAMFDDFTVRDPAARLWPQTERLKASLLAARITGESRYWSMACDAGASLLPYLATTTPGLWFDVQMPDGELRGSLVPASTFYHLVGAILALDGTINGAA